MGKLRDILRDDDSRENLKSLWDTAETAADYDPLPPGDYIADIVSGELFETPTKGTPGYRLTFEVIEGEHTGRRFFETAWLTTRAMPLAKRTLGKLGISDLDQLDRPLPAVCRCEVRLVVRRDDDGKEWNRVQRFEVVKTVEAKADPFAPDFDDDGGLL